MIFSAHIDKISAFKPFLIWISFCAISLLLSACATQPITSTAQLEAYPNAITVPYRISEAGHLIIDIAVNGHPAKPFIIDSGANITAVYEAHVSSLDLSDSGNSTSVSGLVATAVRPLAEDLELKIGTRNFERDRVVVLKNPVIPTDVVGLLGVDILGEYAMLFNKTDMTASLISSQDLNRGKFSGWRSIPLRHRVGSFPDKGLYFATIFLEGSPAPVLIDTGSDLNFVNWELASKDEEFEKLHRSLRKAMKLYGAIDSVPLRMQGRFFDVRLGKQRWDSVDVVVLEFNALSNIAPVDKPMMLAGVNMFSSNTFVFDFGGDRIYVQPGEGDVNEEPKFEEQSEDHLEPIWGDIN